MAQTNLKKASVKPSGAQARKLEQLLRMGRGHLRTGDYASASKYIVEAWKMNPDDLDLLIAVADVLAKLGARAQAFGILERALALHGAKPNAVLMLGKLAADLDMYDMMERVFRIYIMLKPGAGSGYDYLAHALIKQDKLDEAVALLQEILPLFPQHAELWTCLGDAVAARDGYAAAVPFYSEAYRLAPRSYTVLNNVSLAFAQTGDYPQAIAFARQAIRADGSRANAHIGLATSLLAVGQLAEGWREYEWRKQVRNQAAATFKTTLPRWDGGALTGKRLLIGPEQGVGDEILFALTYKGLMAEGAELYIGCDRRLTGLFARSFPGATTGAYLDHFHNGFRYRSMPSLPVADLFVECGSVPLHRWTKPADIPDMADGFLQPEPRLLDLWRKRLAALGPKPKIGIYWRSGKQNSIRSKLYAPIEAWAPVFTQIGPHADFINLQYGDSGDERALVAERFGVTIHHWEDTDLMDDLETVAALSKTVDLAIGPASAPGMFAFAVGTPTWWLLPIKPWWSFGAAETPPFFSKGRMLIGKIDDPWTDLMPRLAADLQDFIAAPLPSR